MNAPTERTLLQDKLTELLQAGFYRQNASGGTIGDFNVSVAQRGRVVVARKFSARQAVFHVALTVHELDAMIAAMQPTAAPEPEDIPTPATAAMSIDWRTVANLTASVALAALMLLAL